MTSIYIWNGNRDEGQEAATLLKTNSAMLDRAVARRGEPHPYEEPAILGWRRDASAPETAAWLGTLGR